MQEILISKLINRFTQRCCQHEKYGTGQFLKRKGFKSEIFQEEIIQEEIIQVEIIQVGNDRSKKSYKWEMIEVRKLTSRNL